jgi:hypothetical protein
LHWFQNFGSVIVVSTYGSVAKILPTSTISSTFERSLSLICSFISTLFVFFMKKFIFGTMLIGPLIASAQVPGPIGTTLLQLQDVVNFLIPLMIAIAVLVFFWGLVKYIANASDEAAKESGRALMIWGMIGLFVMVAFWGIIGFVQESFGISGNITTTPAPVVTFGS